MDKFSNNTCNFNIERYPKSDLASLKPWNAADEYILSYIEENNLQAPTAIINDRFGFLALALHHTKPTLIIDYKSQEKAIQKNLDLNHLDKRNYSFTNILTGTDTKHKLAIVKVPKSMELFALYLKQVSQIIDNDGKVICGFMTKYFTKSMLDVAGLYFEKVEQSLAWKKSRLLILSHPIRNNDSITETVSLPDDNQLTQYKGVFSSGKIDIGTRFLLEHLQIKDSENKILDLACGNGIIAYHLAKQNTNAELHLMDDFFLAVESAKINLPKAHCHLSNELDIFENLMFDMIVTNPPFHFGHQTNIEVSLGLFKQAARCLKASGRLVIVANRHLNYRTHLRKSFKEVEISKENPKFQIIECRQPIL